MQKTNVNLVPGLLKTGNISQQQARNLIWEELFNFPFKYGMGSLTSDQKSEFLLWLSERFTAFIKNYQENTIPFEYFLNICVQKYQKNWLKKQSHYYSGENCFTDQFCMEYEQKEQDNQCEIGHLLNDNEKRSVLKQKINTAKNKQKKIIQDYIHIYACKACNELDVQTIDNISEVLEMDFEKFKKQIEDLKLATRQKVIRRKEMISRRDRAFFFHKRALYELGKFENGSGIYKKTLDKYNFQTKNWQNLNEQLRKRFKMSPTSLDIALNTGINARKISFYLCHKKKKKALQDFLEEDSLGNSKNDEE